MAYTDKLRVVYGDYTLGVHGEGYDYIFITLRLASFAIFISLLIKFTSCKRKVKK